VDSERLKRRFDAWEARMRGQSSRPYNVPIEPEYRPLLGRQRIHRGVIDDTRRPGFFEQFREKSKPKRAPEHGEVEPIPEAVPFEGSGETVELQLLVHSDVNVPNAIGAALLVSLSGASHHLAFEVLAVGERVVVQITCDEADVASVRSSLRTHVPDVRVIGARDYLLEAWKREDGFAVIVPFALSDRVFRSLRTSREANVDPLAEIIGRMDGLGPRETLFLQVLFAPARAPWRKDLEEFVSSIDDIDHVMPLVREKFSEPLFAAVVRIAAFSPTEEQALARARALAAALVSQTKSPRNNLELSRSGKISFEEEVADLIARQTRRRGMILSLSELQTIAHLPSAAVRSSRLVRAVSRTKAAPDRVAEKGLVLGMNAHDNRERSVALSTPERLKHIHIIGSTGSGKSTLILNMAVQDIEAGNGFAVLDPHGDLIEDIIARIPAERANDVVLFDPSDGEHPVAFNPLSAHSELERTLLASDFVAIFRRLSSTTFGDQMVSVLGNAVLAILESPKGGTLLDLRHLLVDKAFRDRFLETVEDDEVRHYWRHEFPLIKGVPHSSILTRLNTFLRPRIVRHMVAQRDDRLNMRAVMDDKKILLAKLSRGLIGEENSHLLGSLLVAKIGQATVSRQDEEASRRTPFTLYMDEAHNFATPSVAEILSGARKYAVSICFGHGEIRQVRSRSEEVASAILAHAYTRIVFQVGEQDARTLASGFSFFEPRDLENLGVGEAIMRIERPDFDFNLRTTLPDPVPKDTRDSRAAAIRAASRSAYGTPRTDVEADLSASRPDAQTSEAEQAPRRRRTNPDLGTGLGPDVRPGRGGAQHKYLQSLIRRVAETRGFAVSLEKSVLEGHGYVDVALDGFGVSIACEISVSTGVEHEVGNLTKCLVAGFDYALLVSTNDTLLDLARAELSDADTTRVRALRPGAVAAFLDDIVGEEAPTKRPTPKHDEKPNQHLLMTEDAGAYVGLAVQTLARMRVSGEGPHFHKLGRRVVYSRADLDAWVAARKRRSTSDLDR
jgi:predicted DNA-binding transcriptional regulator AlpA